MTIYEMFVQMWVIDFEIGIFDKSYFQSLVQSGQLKVEDYKKVTGEDYVTPQAQPAQSATAPVTQPVQPSTTLKVATKGGGK